MRALLAMIVGLSLLGLPGMNADGAASDLACPHLFDEYLQQHGREPLPYTDPETQMVYFLHVPRTAGRTLHSCLLKPGMPPQKRCAKAYDHLRINMSVPNCYLLSSHDDYSVVSMLPHNVAVLTQLRDPVDRFLSAYEFAVEVATRAVVRPANFKKRPDKIATDDVWPWSYLIPFFKDDMAARVGGWRMLEQRLRGLMATCWACCVHAACHCGATAVAQQLPPVCPGSWGSGGPPFVVTQIHGCSPWKGQGCATRVGGRAGCFGGHWVTAAGEMRAQQP